MRTAGITINQYLNFSYLVDENQNQLSKYELETEKIGLLSLKEIMQKNGSEKVFEVIESLYKNLFQINRTVKTFESIPVVKTESGFQISQKRLVFWNMSDYIEVVRPCIVGF